jgi:hypothetical protein
MVGWQQSHGGASRLHRVCALPPPASDVRLTLSKTGDLAGSSGCSEIRYRQQPARRRARLRLPPRQRAPAAGEQGADCAGRRHRQPERAEDRRQAHPRHEPALEPPFQYGADYAGLVPAEGAGGRTFDAGFTTPDGNLILVDAKRTALIHKGMLEKVCDPEFFGLFEASQAGCQQVQSASPPPAAPPAPAPPPLPAGCPLRSQAAQKHTCSRLHSHVCALCTTPLSRALDAALVVHSALSYHRPAPVSRLFTRRAAYSLHKANAVTSRRRSRFLCHCAVAAAQGACDVGVPARAVRRDEPGRASRRRLSDVAARGRAGCGAAGAAGGRGLLRRRRRRRGRRRAGRRRVGGRRGRAAGHPAAARAARAGV